MLNSNNHLVTTPFFFFPQIEGCSHQSAPWCLFSVLEVTSRSQRCHGCVVWYLYMRKQNASRWLWVIHTNNVFLGWGRWRWSKSPVTIQGKSMSIFIICRQKAKDFYLYREGRIEGPQEDFRHICGWGIITCSFWGFVFCILSFLI